MVTGTPKCPETPIGEPIRVHKKGMPIILKKDTAKGLQLGTPRGLRFGDLNNQGKSQMGPNQVVSVRSFDPFISDACLYHWSQ